MPKLHRTQRVKIEKTPEAGYNPNGIRPPSSSRVLVELDPADLRILEALKRQTGNTISEMVSGIVHEYMEGQSDVAGN